MPRETGARQNEKATIKKSFGGEDYGLGSKSGQRVDAGSDENGGAKFDGFHEALHVKSGALRLRKRDGLLPRGNKRVDYGRQAEASGSGSEMAGILRIDESDERIVNIGGDARGLDEGRLVNIMLKSGETDEIRAEPAPYQACGSKGNG